VKEGVGSSVIVPTRDFVGALRSVSFSASTSSVKPELAAIFLSLEKGELTAVATDSFRLAEVRTPLKVKGGFGSLLLPARNIPDIVRAIESSADIEVRVADNQCSFISDFGHITSRTIDGSFPDYRAIIPNSSVVEATCLKEDAVRAFKKV
jgi:DNA polymerase-3 subunit beta